MIDWLIDWLIWLNQVKNFKNWLFDLSQNPFTPMTALLSWDHRTALQKQRWDYLWAHPSRLICWASKSQLFMWVHLFLERTLIVFDKQQNSGPCAKICSRFFKWIFVIFFLFFSSMISWFFVSSSEKFSSKIKSSICFCSLPLNVVLTHQFVNCFSITFTSICFKKRWRFLALKESVKKSVRCLRSRCSVYGS